MGWGRVWWGGSRSKAVGLFVQVDGVRCPLCSCWFKHIDLTRRPRSRQLSGPLIKGTVCGKAVTVVIGDWKTIFSPGVISSGVEI